MQNKDLVSCCLTYGANAKTAILPCLSLLESKCESEYQKGNFANSKDALCSSRLLHFTQDLCSYLESIQREYSLATVSAEPLNKFCLVCLLYYVSIVGDLYALARQKVELAQQLSQQLPLVCQLYVRSPSANYVCQSCHLLVFLSTNKV